LNSTNYNNIPEYYISYNKEHNINKYSFKINNTNILIKYNEVIAIDDNTKYILKYFKDKYNFKNDEIIELQLEYDKCNERIEKIKNQYNEDKKIFKKINEDINNNKITYLDIASFFKEKYDFFINYYNNTDDDNLIKYEKYVNN
jgi:hypothetical protein